MVKNEYHITGLNEWSALYWQGTFVHCINKQERYHLMINLCLRQLRGEQIVFNFHRQWGYQRAMNEALDIYNKMKL